MPRAIAAEAGFRLAISGDLAGPVHVTQMRGVPLVRALRRPLGETSMVMRLEVASEDRRVAELRLRRCPDNDRGASPPGAETKARTMEGEIENDA